MADYLSVTDLVTRAKNGEKQAWDAGRAGALCDDETRARLRQIGESHDWADR